MFLCDTNIISEFVKPEPNAGVIDWARKCRTVSASAITVEEIYFGFSWKPKPKIQALLEKILAQRFQILEVTSEICYCAGITRGQHHANGQTRAQADMLIAATAKTHQLTLVTPITDFEDCGIDLINPFSEI